MDRRKQTLTLALAWLAYATYYLGRRGFGVVKKKLHDELGVSEVALGRIDTAYLTAYSIGQFLSGFLGDHIGARRLVGYGMLLSAAMCAAFGSFNAALGFGIAFAVNGLAQATGWPGTTRAMADVTTPETRGRPMGIFSTSYQVGGFVAVWLAGALATAFGWRAAFYGPAVLIALVAITILAFLPTATPHPIPTPTSAPTPAPARTPTATATATATTAPAPEDLDPRRARREAQRAVLRNPTIWLFATSYFFVKIIRYVLLFWLPYYLSTRFGWSTMEAAGISTAFDAGGFVGVVVIGALSDRTRSLGRAGLAAVWLFGLVLACGAYVLWGSGGKLVNIALIMLIGAMLFGPDSILCGAAAMDAGGPRAAAMATGFVNGIGSIGPILQGLLVPPLAKHYGWQALFPVLLVLALCAALVLVPALLKTRALHKAQPNADVNR